MIFTLNAASIGLFVFAGIFTIIAIMLLCFAEVGEASGVGAVMILIAIVLGALGVVMGQSQMPCISNPEYVEVTSRASNKVYITSVCSCENNEHTYDEIINTNYPDLYQIGQRFNSVDEARNYIANNYDLSELPAATITEENRTVIPFPVFLYH